MQNKQIPIPADVEPWLKNLIELKNRSEKTIKQIAEEKDLAEKSVQNVFYGKAKNPGVGLIRKIINSFGGHWSEIFDDTGAVIGGQDLAALEVQVAELTRELEVCQANLEILTIENKVLTDKIATIESEKNLLAIRLEYEQKLNAVHNYYNERNET